MLETLFWCCADVRVTREICVLVGVFLNIFLGHVKHLSCKNAALVTDKNISLIIPILETLLTSYLHLSCRWFLQNFLWGQGLLPVLAGVRKTQIQSSPRRLMSNQGSEVRPLLVSVCKRHLYEPVSCFTWRSYVMQSCSHVKGPTTVQGPILSSCHCKYGTRKSVCSSHGVCRFYRRVTRGVYLPGRRSDLIHLFNFTFFFCWSFLQIMFFYFLTLFLLAHFFIENSSGDFQIKIYPSQILIFENGRLSFYFRFASLETI